MTTKTKTTRTSAATARATDRNWLAGQHPENIRRIARSFRVANRAGDPPEEMRERIRDKLDHLHDRGNILDIHCPICRAPVVLAKEHPQTPEEVEAGQARQTLRCLGVHRHQFRRVVPSDLT